MIAALQTLPTSGSLSSHSVMSEPRPTRKSRSVDALKKTNNAVEVIITVARLFWSERKVDKARDWFGRAVVANGDFGDAWGWWYKFEKNHGNKVSPPSLLSSSSVVWCGELTNSLDVGTNRVATREMHRSGSSPRTDMADDQQGSQEQRQVDRAGAGLGGGQVDGGGGEIILFYFCSELGLLHSIRSYECVSSATEAK